jgi:hypothetical protein
MAQIHMCTSLDDSSNVLTSKFLSSSEIVNKSPGRSHGQVGAKKLSSNDNFSKNLVRCSYFVQIERFLLQKVGFGTL